MKRQLLILLTLVPFFINAQSVEWITRPNYDYLEIIQHDLVKIKVGGKTGIITNRGDVVVEPIYDSITDFKDGIALVVDKRCKQLIGIVYGDTKTMLKKDGYEVDSDFPYFSDGMLAVKNTDGKWGFLNVDSEECQGYLSCKNDNVLPFSDGYTFVTINSKEHAYFDVNGNPLIGDFGKTVEGYSFLNGEAFVLLSNLSWAWIDVNGNIKKTIKAPKQKALPTKNGKTITHCGNVFEFDDQWCLVKGNINGVVEEYQHNINFDINNVVSNGMLSVSDNRLSYNSEEIIPMQFDNIIILNGDYVAVSINGKYGILHIIPNQSFTADVLTKEIVFYHASQGKVSYNINMPNHLRDKDVDIILKDSNSNNVAFETIHNDNVSNISFYVEPTDDKLNRKSSEEFYVAVTSDGIRYMEESFVIDKIQKKGFSISCKNKIIHSDSLGYANCEITIRNNTKIKSGITEVTISYDENEETKVKVFKPGESINIPIRINAVMSDDCVNKEINIRVSEDNYPTIYSKETLTIYRYIPENN